MKAWVKQSIEKSLLAAYFRYTDLLRNIERRVGNKDILFYRDRHNKSYNVLTIDGFFRWKEGMILPIGLSICLTIVRETPTSSATVNFRLSNGGEDYLKDALLIE